MITTVDQLKSEIRRDDTGRYSLTDLWKLAGSDENRKPAGWQRTAECQAFVRAASRFLNVVSNHIIESKRGRGGGTWAHEQVFLEYAQYLDARLSVLVNQAFIDRTEEEANPELAIQRGNDRAAATWQKQGKDQNWIAGRTIGVTTRKAFTLALRSHGVRGEGYRSCTNAIYQPLYGGTSVVVRHKKGLDKKASIRDNMSMVELAAVMLSESMAAETIQRENLQGNAGCEVACNRAARTVARAIIQNRNSA